MSEEADLVEKMSDRMWGAIGKCMCFFHSISEEENADSQTVRRNTMPKSSCTRGKLSNSQ
jgi:hypothetical protein